MELIIKRYRYLLFLLLLITGVSFAVVSPVAMMQKVSNRMIAQLERNKSQLRRPGVIHRIVNRTLVPYVAMSRMAGSVTGRYWRTASRSQRRTFVREFKRLVISTYSSALASYNGDKVRFYPLRMNYRARRAVQVRSVIIRRNGQRVSVTYNLVRSGRSWKVYDFSIENISMVSSYRSQFSGVLARGGMPGLLQRLKQHNRRTR